MVELVSDATVQPEEAGVLERIPDEVEHVVRFETTVRGYRKPDVDAYVTQAENRLASLREKTASLEARVRDAEWRADQAERQGLKWKQKFEEHAPPFEELGTHVANLLQNAEEAAAASLKQGEDERAALVKEGEEQAAEIAATAEAEARRVEAEAAAKVRALQAEFDRLVDRIEAVRDALGPLPSRADSQLADPLGDPRSI